MTLDKKGIYSIQVSAECVKCGLCVKCCPGLGVDFDSLNRELFGKIPQDPFLGHVISSYIGCALEPSVRQAGASGGIITAIGSYLFSTGQVDGICVVRASNEDPLLPDIFIAKDADDMLSAAQSKYYPVPINQGLEEIMAMRGRFAIVGKPCDIHGIRKAAHYIPEVRKRIVLTLGIMCMWGGSRQGIINWLHHLGIRDYDKIEKIKFREGEWPGQRVVSLKNGSKISPSIIEAFVTPFTLFCPNRCSLCPDQTNELADISVGDAWIRDIHHFRGTAVIMGRTISGHQILQEAQEKKVLDLQNVQTAKVIESQDYMLYYKKIAIKARERIVQAHKKPAFNISYLPAARPSLLDHIAAVIWHATRRATREGLFCKVLRYLPPVTYEWFTKTLFKLVTHQTFFRSFSKADINLLEHYSTPTPNNQFYPSD